MPEGPEIRRAADAVAEVFTERLPDGLPGATFGERSVEPSADGRIVHYPITGVFFAFNHLKPYENKLLGHRVMAVNTKGKAMIIQFDNQLSIYSHSQLYGKWFVQNAHTPYPPTNRQLRLAIHTARKSALLYSASDIAVLTADELAKHPFLSRVGPDVLGDALTGEQVAQRFTDQKFCRQRLASLLLDQRFLCGLGNYLRSEILFVAKVHPLLRPSHCKPEQITRLAEAVLTVTHQSYVTGGITNTLELAEQLRQQGYSRAEYRHHVFNRDGKPCFLCSTEIVKDVFSGRRCYYCPHCQHAEHSA